MSDLAPEDTFKLRPRVPAVVRPIARDIPVAPPPVEPSRAAPPKKKVPWGAIILGGIGLFGLIGFSQIGRSAASA